MSTEEMVDASLVGFEKKQLITIPSLPNEKDWEAFEAARSTLGPNLSRSKAASRYREALNMAQLSKALRSARNQTGKKTRTDCPGTH